MCYYFDIHRESHLKMAKNNNKGKANRKRKISETEVGEEGKSKPKIKSKVVVVSSNSDAISTKNKKSNNSQKSNVRDNQRIQFNELSDADVMDVLDSINSEADTNNNATLLTMGENSTVNRTQNVRRKLPLAKRGKERKTQPSSNEIICDDIALTVNLNESELAEFSDPDDDNHSASDGEADSEVYFSNRDTRTVIADVHNDAEDTVVEPAEPIPSTSSAGAGQSKAKSLVSKLSPELKGLLDELLEERRKENSHQQL